MVSSILNWSPSSPRAISKLQPPYLKSSDPPGSSRTPSSETNSVTTILPMSALLLVWGGRGPAGRIGYSSRSLNNREGEQGHGRGRAQPPLRRPGGPDPPRHH